MNENIKFNIDLKWWSSIEAQQKLTVGMAIIILALSGACLLLFRANEKNIIEAAARFENLRLSKNVEIAAEKASKESCWESQILYLKENEKRYQELFFKTQNLNNKFYENTND